MKPTEQERRAQSEADRIAYRMTCSRRRRGRIIEELHDGKWMPVFTGNSINEAKRKNRGTAGVSYAE